MAFAGTPVSKGLILGLGSLTLLAAITSSQHYFNVPLQPHLTRDHQWWRLVVHHVAFANSSELFVGVLLLFYTSPALERSFGSRKYASFLVVTTAVSTALASVALLLGSRFGFDAIPAGPFAIIFAIVSQSTRLIPSSFYWRLFGFEITNRIALYILAAQLFASQPPATALVSIIGIFSSTLYLSNFLSIRTYRISPRLVVLLTRFLSPLVGSTAPARRPTVTTPQELVRSPAVVFPGSNALMRAAGVAPLPQVATPAAPRPANAPAPPAAAAPATANLAPPNPGIVQQWTQGITGGQNVPTAAQIAELSAIFPDQSREQVVAALQRNEMDVNRAVASLLMS